MVFTYRTVLDDFIPNHYFAVVTPYQYYDDMGKLFGELERKLFVDLYKNGLKLKDLKRQYIQEYQITARQFNAIRVSLEGKINSIKELQKSRLADLVAKIKATEKAIKQKEKSKEKVLKQIKKLEQGSEKWQQKIDKLQRYKFFLYQKRRRLRNLIHKLDKLKSEIGHVSICFGSKKLFKNQHNLELTDFKTHADWKEAWQEARSSNFLLVGSKDENSGNQSCTYSSNNELRIRVAYRFQSIYGKYIELPDITFKYGQEELDLAREQKKAITFRFIRKDTKWYLHASVEIDYPDAITNTLNGAIGVDLNNGFLQVAELDRFGNPLTEFKIPFEARDRSTDQITASLGDAIKQVVDYAKQRGKSIVIENLDFTKKKAVLRETSTKYSRMLSGFVYAKFKAMLLSRALRNLVEFIQVKPYFTSIIGQLNYMTRYGFSSHGAAAVVIARLGLGFKLASKITNNLLTDVLNLPERKQTSRFNYWSRVSKKLKKGLNYKDRLDLIYVSGF